MTRQIDITVMPPSMEQIIDQGWDGLTNAMNILLKKDMKVEPSRALGFPSWQRTEERLVYANGY